jgi:hypothetical protein
MSAAFLVTAMSVTASAHIWNRPAAAFAHPTTHLDPCPVSFDFKSGFCVKASGVKKAWFARAVERMIEGL